MTFEELALQYALPVIVMACIVMVAIGIIKIFTKMIPEKNSKLRKIMSYVYVILAPAFSFGAVCAYYAIFGLEFDWVVIIEMFAATWGCSQALYPIYRDLGGRAFLLKVLSLFKGKSKKADDIIAVIEQVLVLTEKQKDAIAEKLNEK